MSIAGYAMLLLVMLCHAVHAEPVENPKELITQTHQELEKAEQLLSELTSISSSQEKSLRDVFERSRDTAARCLRQTEAELKQLKPQQTILDTPQSEEGESALPAIKEEALTPEIAQERQAILDRIVLLQERRILCKLILLRAEESTLRLNAMLQAKLSQQLKTRGPSFAEAVKQSLGVPEKWQTVSRHISSEFMDWQLLNQQQRLFSTGIVLLGLIVGVGVSQWLKSGLRMSREEDTLNSKLRQAGLGSLVRYLPWLAAFGLTRVYLTTIPTMGETLLLTFVVDGLLLFILLLAMIRMLFLPVHPDNELQTLPLPRNFTEPMNRHARVFLILAAFYLLLFRFVADKQMDQHVLVLLINLWAITLVINVLRIVWLTRRIPGWENIWFPQFLLTVVFCGSLLVSWLGYRNLAHLVTLGTLGTLVLMGIALLVVKALTELIDGLDEGQRRWQQVMRGLIGVHGKDPVPGLFGVRLLVQLGVWLSFILLLPWIWGVNDQVNPYIWSFILEGVAVAGIPLVPVQLFLAILLLVLLMTFVRWFKTRLATKWLQKSHLARGAKEALVTTTGYIGFTIALLVSLTVAGIQFSNLAIVAGALSVGIGFGLQNVVNNFVSGLIMLVERPVETGDWIVVGNTEGYVKRISIRTTSIQTFDRGMVIVPNSDLISGQVTNWMLQDHIGRIKVPISVAYGTDTGLVRDLLLDIAQKHPQVLKEHAIVSNPWVVFLGFGDSSLDFELRGFVREVDSRMTVISEINFSIDAVFREHNIKIPFPQRDLNLCTPLQVMRATPSAQPEEQVEEPKPAEEASEPPPPPSQRSASATKGDPGESDL